MTDTWTFQKLRDLADIRVSNVDKKTYSSEKQVKLCNYMDVYSNEYITNEIQFMEASANRAEIDSFSLNIGDVVITKDSETPDDIGIPAVIHEKIDNLVCGYHLAIIRPDKDKLDSIFLSKYLSTSPITKYFALHASGSTRFGLPIGSIELTEIPTPPKKEQTQIATILSTIDHAIEQTEAIIAKQQRIKTGLMQDLLTKGIDEDGNIRSEKTHQFKDSPLGRIPVEWEVKCLDDLLTGISQGWSPDCESEPAAIGEWGILKTTSVVWQGFDAQENKKLPVNLKPRTSLEVKKEDVLMTRAGPNSRVGVVAYVYETPSQRILSDKIYRLETRKKLEKRFLVYSLSSDASQRHLSTMKTGMAESQTNISQDIVRKMLTVLPLLNEQIRISDFLDNKFQGQKHDFGIRDKLVSLKTGLMQDLLTGNIRVTALLDQSNAST